MPRNSNNYSIGTAKYILYFLAIYVLGWGFTEYKSIFMGLILGTSVSLFNHWHLMRKTTQFERCSHIREKNSTLLGP